MPDCLDMTDEEYAQEDNICEMCGEQYATHTVRCAGMVLLVCDEATCQDKASNHCSATTIA